MHNVLCLGVQTAPAFSGMKLSLNTDCTLVPVEISWNAKEGAVVSRCRWQHFHVFHGGQRLTPFIAALLRMAHLRGALMKMFSDDIIP